MPLNSICTKQQEAFVLGKQKINLKEIQELFVVV
jgi:hypothetical protein